jgi:hypothetical protein
MMTTTQNDKFISKLGKYFGETELSLFLTELEITGKPKLKRGESTTHLSNESHGIELTFRDTDTLRVNTRDYPDGALALCNVRFYGTQIGSYQPFVGQLPFGVIFGDSKSALLSKIGVPAEDDEDLRLLRWDFQGFCAFAKLGKSGDLRVFGVQLPVA